MLRILSGIAIASALAVAGCGNAPAPATVPEARVSASPCPTRLVHTTGRTAIAPGGQGTYVASMEGPCRIDAVEWAVQNGATIVSQSGARGEVVTVQAPAEGSFSVQARVGYERGLVAYGAARVTVQ